MPDRKLITRCLRSYFLMLRYRSAAGDAASLAAMLVGVVIGLELADSITHDEALRLKALIDNAEHYAQLGTGMAGQ